MKRFNFSAMTFATAAFVALLASSASAADAQTKEQKTLLQREQDPARDWLKVDAKPVNQYAAGDMSAEFRFTDTYVKRDFRWQCVTSQTNLIAKA